jgi:hypothetical protein
MESIAGDPVTNADNPILSAAVAKDVDTSALESSASQAHCIKVKSN